MNTQRIAVLILCSLLFLCAAGQDRVQKGSARECYDRGIDYLNHGNWEEAGAQFKQALVEDPLYREAHELYQNVEYYYFEKTQSVFSEYAKLLQSHPREPLYHYLIARIATQQQRDSLGIFKSPIALDSAFVPEYNRMLPILFYQGKTDEARALIEAGLRHSPNNVDLLFAESQLYMKQAKAKESSDVLRTMLRLHPNSETTLYACIGLAIIAETDAEKMELLEHAVRLDTSGIRSDAYWNLFQLYAKSDPEKAIKFARKALLMKQSYRDRQLPSAMYDCLYGLFVKTDTTKAIELAKEVSSLTNRDPRMYLTFGNSMLSLKKELKLTVQLLEKALEYHVPENVYGISCFGSMTRTGIHRHWEKSEGAFRLSLGSAYFANAEYPKALGILQSGLGRNDQVDPNLYYKIGMTYEKLAKPQEAMASYIRSLSFREDAKVRSSLEALASRETNLKIAIPARQVTDVDSAIAQAQISRTKKAPAFQLKNLDGVTVSSSSFQGKVLVLDFWATWCGPCVAELPKLQDLFKKYERNPGVRVVAINTEVNDKEVKKFIEKRGFTFPVLMDKGTTAVYGVQGIPALFVVDRTGLIRYKHEGYDPNVDFVSMLSKEIEIILSMTNKK
jgi:peroxiredoxin/Tfp pilus assembly protein PilF